jgi:hypothetical protein
LDDTIKYEEQSGQYFRHSAQIKGGLANLYLLKGDKESYEKYAEAARQADKFNPYFKDFK